jgi:D-amino-acid dehydrogenase
VIGPARKDRRVIYAFGHGHYGLTQAAITSRLVADLVEQKPIGIDLKPFLPKRF